MKKFFIYERARSLHRDVTNLIQHSNFDHSIEDQLRRASRSIVLNIAEGNGRRTTADRRRFFVIARGSLEECRAVISILLDEGLIVADQGQALQSEYHILVKMITKLIYNLSK